MINPADVAALAVHLMTNTAVTGATFDIDGGQQFVEGELRGGVMDVCSSPQAAKLGSRTLSRVETRVQIRLGLRRSENTSVSHEGKWSRIGPRRTADRHGYHPGGRSSPRRPTLEPSTAAPLSISAF
jgi:hypothetical protein